MNQYSQTDEVFWKGKKLSDLSKEELIKAVTFLVHSEHEVREDRARWRAAGDPIKYMMSKGDRA